MKSSQLLHIEVAIDLFISCCENILIIECHVFEVALDVLVSTA